MEESKSKMVLGLDLGVTSIGWAFIEENENDQEKSSILGMGSRIIPLSSEENDEFTKGNAQSTNAGRRDKRGARRNLQRYKLRKQLLHAVLKGTGLTPSEHLFQLNAISLFGLRDKAVKEQILLEEFGRLLFMLNQKRGYKSNRKANNEDETTPVTETADDSIEDENAPFKKPRKKGYLDLIADREAILRKENITIGQYFCREIQQNHQFRVKENIFTRASYIAEFDKIWNTQKVFYPDVLTEKLFQTIRNEVIYFQRALKSQKALVSECRFEKHHKVAPKSSPLFQICKMWQEINNIEITSFKAIKGTETDTSFGIDGKRKLTLAEKQKLFDVLSSSEKMTKRKMLELFGYKIGYDNYSINIQKDLEGNRTVALLAKTFDKLGINRNELLEFSLNDEVIGKDLVDTNTGEIIKRKRITSSFEKQPLYQLWHLIYSLDETQVLEKALKVKYKFTDEQTKAIVKLDFHKSGYGSLSARAIRNILPYLQQGMKYSDACDNAGYRHSDYKTMQENADRQLKERLELLQKGTLRNPVVEKIINHTINLVNAILENPLLGKPDEIRVELARELRQNADERKRTFKNITEKDKEHKRIVELLQKEQGISRVSRNDIERFKLWEEFGKVSPYDPHKTISLSELFGGGYDIEHIIPKSRVFDDSFANKTICPRTLNSGINGKNQMTAYDFMKSRGEKEFHAYVEFVSSFYKESKNSKERRISKAKFERLMMPADKIPDDFVNRQLNDTRYISREIKGILTQICRNVYSSSGTITSELRHLWGYDEITMRLNNEKYEQIGKTYSFTDKNGNVHKRIQDWSKRDDHRHHAIDALVIACTKQSIIQRMNNLNQTFISKTLDNPKELLREKEKEYGLDNYIDELRPFTSSQVEKAVSQILISFKSGKRVAIANKNSFKHKAGNKPSQVSLTPRGFLHKETVYGKILQYEQVVLSPRFNRFEDIAYSEAKEFLISFLSKYNSDAKKAFSVKVLPEIINTIKGTPVKGIAVSKNEILKVTCFKPEFVVRYPISGLKVKDIEYIVDKKVKTIIKQRIDEKGEKDAFKDIENNPVWLNKEKAIPIKSVRMKTGLEGLVSLHKSKAGKTFPSSKHIDGAIQVDYVSTRNNHHIAIYRDSEGKLCENAVTFWDALNRKRFGIPVVIKNPESVWDFVLANTTKEKPFPQDVLECLPKDGWDYITSMQQNEMFIFGLDMDSLKIAVETNDYATISKHLYRVQKIASNDYFFRHHLETKLDDSADARDIKKYFRISTAKMNGIKVIITRLGRIEKIGE